MRQRIALKAYTLVEVMIVLSIIGVLVSFLFTGAFKARQKAKIVRIHALMDSIGAAIRMYQDDFGAVPPDDVVNRFGSTIEASSPECLYYYLGAQFKGSVNASKFAGPYMRFTGNEISISRTTICDFDADGGIDDDLYNVMDPWGRSLHYVIPPVHNLNTYDLYSEGPNGIDDSGNADDVNNWD